MAIMLENIIMDAVVKELPSYNADITDKPVERGQDISDHMQMKIIQLEITGSMVNNAVEKLSQLKKYQEESTLLTYIGRNKFHNMVIKSFNPDHGKENAEGFDYSFILQQVRIAQPETFKIKVKNPVTQTQNKKTATKVKTKTASGRKQGTVKEVKKQQKVNANQFPKTQMKDRLKAITTPPSIAGLKNQTRSVARK